MLVIAAQPVTSLERWLRCQYAAAAGHVTIRYMVNIEGR